LNECEGIRELLPWYVTGKLGAKDASAVAAHVQTCAECRGELAEVVWARHTVGRKTSDRPSVGERVWRKVMARAGLGDIANVDVGSLLVGFHLGVSTRRAGSPVRASMRVMGRNVRIVGRGRRSECTDPKSNE
jgi:anti-sigma factor RsiW